MKKLLFSCLLWLLPTLTWATTVNAWLNPATLTVTSDSQFTLDLIVNSDSMMIDSYDFTVTLDTSKLQFDTTYQNVAQYCESGVCIGTNALFSNIIYVDAMSGVLSLVGLGGEVGPGNDLQLFVIHLKAKTVIGATPVTLVTNKLLNTSGSNISTGAAGATVNVTTTAGLCGDVDGNGIVNVVDALAINRKVVGLPPPPTVDVSLADVNLDGVVNVIDAFYMLFYYVGRVFPHDPPYESCLAQ